MDGTLQTRCDRVDGEWGMASSFCDHAWAGWWTRADSTWDEFGCLTELYAPAWSEEDGYAGGSITYTCDEQHNSATAFEVWAGYADEHHRYDNTYQDGVLVQVDDWLVDEVETLSATHTYTWEAGHVVEEDVVEGTDEGRYDWEWTGDLLTSYRLRWWYDGELFGDSTTEYTYDAQDRLATESTSYDVETFSYTRDWPGPTSSTRMDGDSVEGTSTWTYTCPGAPRVTGRQ